MFTFVQPIVWNARQIKSKDIELESIVLNLWGLHTYLSFQGNIGNIMKASGLKQILSLIYSENIVNDMLNGKEFYRGSMFFLIDAALNHFIIDGYFSKDNQYVVYSQTLLNKIMEDDDEDCVINDEEIIAITDIFRNVEEKLKEHLTGELRIQFMELMQIVSVGDRAQRTNKFKLYLKSFRMMHQYFPATEHNYAKNIQIFTRYFSLKRN